MDTKTEFLDERIALLEKREREVEREERERQRRLAQGEEETAGLTLEEAREGLRAGRLEAGGRSFLFKSRPCCGGRLPWFDIENFYEESFQEDEQGNAVTMLTGVRENVNIYLTQLQSDIILKPMEERKKEMRDTFQDLGMYADLQKDAQLENLDYLCFTTPTGKGAVYNIIFWLHNGEQKIIGNLGCMETDRSILGILLEAMVLETNETL